MWFYRFLWLLNSKLEFFKKAKPITQKRWFHFYYHIFWGEVQRILESYFFLLAPNSCRAGRFLLDNKIFFLTFNTITFLLPKDALYFYKEKEYKCLYSKSTSSKLNSLKSHEKRHRGLNISENRKLIFIPNEFKIFCIPVWYTLARGSQCSNL